MKYQGKSYEFLFLEHVSGKAPIEFKMPLASGLMFLWFKKKQKIQVDGQSIELFPNQIVCTTELHRVETTTFNEVRLIRFNRSFYCIKDHDNEVSCKGLLFYNASRPSIITLPKGEQRKFEMLWEMFSIEMNTADSLQFEMLQMMLKRFIILCTRLYKMQNDLWTLKTKSVDLLRDFNFLVEQHFKKHHQVATYAHMLHKSPKTLANFFAQNGMDSPLHIIQERIMLEARRLLRYTDKPIKEIAYEIGYEDVQTFSRAFRQKEGMAPSELREN
jgi:AraC family transcriptional regulator, transcriptional activator of pobA